MTRFVKQCYFALSSLAKSRSYSLTVCITLSLALGTLTFAVTLNYSLLFAPVSQKNYEQLTVFTHSLKDEHQISDGHGSTLVGTEHTYQQRHDKLSDVFSNVTIIAQRKEAVKQDNTYFNRLVISYTTSEYFDMLEPPMHLGAYLSAQDIENKRPVAVISYTLWRDVLGLDNKVIGKTLMINEQAIRIIGVMASHFVEPYIFNARSDVWMPWTFHNYSQYDANNWFVPKSEIVTLALRHIHVSQFNSQTILSKLLNSAYQAELKSSGYSEQYTEFGAIATSLRSREIDSSKTFALLLLLVFSGLLIMACSNIYSLFLVRVKQKQHSFAIQAALGARRSYLFRITFIESFILLLIASLGGLLICAWLIELFKVIANDYIARSDELNLGALSWLFSFVMGLILSWVFAYASYSGLQYQTLVMRLYQSSRSSAQSSSHKQFVFSNTVQITLATLIVCAALYALLISYRTVIQPFGFDDTGLHIMSVSAINTENSIKYNEAIVNQVIPLVEQLDNVAWVQPVYSSPANNTMSIVLEDIQRNPISLFPVNYVTGDYFSLLGLDVLSGKVFSKRHIEQNDAVIVVSQSAADLICNGCNVVGTRVYWQQDTQYEIIGVVQDSFLPGNGSFNREQGYDIYLPYQAWQRNILVKFNETKANMRCALTRGLPNAYIDYLLPVSQIYDAQISTDKQLIVVTLLFSIVSLLLAFLGVYGVISFYFANRRRIVAVKLALGMRGANLIKTELKRQLKPLFIALSIAQAIVLVVWFVILNQSNGDDLAVAMFSSVVLMLVVCLCAMYLPLKRIVAEPPSDIFRTL